MTKTLYTLGQAADVLAMKRSLVTFLVNDRRIPTINIGPAKALDESGLETLRKAAEEYQAKILATSA